MDLGPFGAAEVLFIAVLALLVFGPRRLPELSHAAGRMVTRLRRAAMELKRTYESELERAPELKAVTDEVDGLVRVAREEAAELGKAAPADLRALGFGALGDDVPSDREEGPGGGAGPRSS